MSVMTLRRQSNSGGITLPAETRIHMGLEVGQGLTQVECADGVKRVKRNLKLKRQLELACAVLREQTGALQDLARR
jgi:bifunctional DNA-binding transcriptional regulator/antitoxin component of YhaV-PrlF toxin-antitoxin module